MSIDSVGVPKGYTKHIQSVFMQNQSWQAAGAESASDFSRLLESLLTKEMLKPVLTSNWFAGLGGSEYLIETVLVGHISNSLNLMENLKGVGEYDK